MPVNALRRLRDWGGRYIDYRIAWISAVFLGGIVWAINLSHGPLAALPAALKQAAYTFFVAGFIVRLCETISVRVERETLASVLATLIPASIAISLTFLMHSLKGTPEPLHSTVPTLLIAPPAMFFWAKKSRKQHFESVEVPLAEEA